MARQLIVNADDFAISKGITRGIIEGHLQGIITSTSVMVNLPDAQDSFKQAKEQAPKLGLGLHFVLSFGKPVLAAEEVPSLIRSADAFAQNYNELTEMASNFDPTQVKAELRAQFDRFVELAGHPPDHLDSHHGVTEFSQPASETLVELATEYNLPIRKHQYAGAAHLRQPDVMSFDFFDETVSFETLSRVLRNIGDGVTELGCHPGYPADLDEVYKEPRETELRLLTDARIKAIIEEEGIQLISFGDL
jgi:chitin disaccharide deacetylase